MIKRFICFFLISILLICQVAYATVSIPLEAFEKTEKSEPSEPTKKVHVTNNGLVSRSFNPVEKSLDGISYVTTARTIPEKNSILLHLFLTLWM